MFDDYFIEKDSIPLGIHLELQSTHPKEMSLMDIFHLNRSHVTEFANVIYSKDVPEGLKIALTHISWAIRAYLSFQDIFDAKLSFNIEENVDDVELYARQLFDLNKYYCYFEGIAYLKEIVVCLLCSRLLAAMVLLRPFLELSIANVYWILKSDKDTSYQFYKWLLSGKYRQKYTNMVDYIFENCGVKKLLNLGEYQKNIKKLYSELCSYNHTPNLHKSIISHSGNTEILSHDYLAKFITLFDDTMNQINLMYLINYPMALFPQDIYRHFGYCNGPEGLYFDEFNYAIISQYLGNDEITILTKALENYSIKEDLISYINSFPKLNDIEMEDSWKEFVKEILKDSKYYNINDHSHRVTIFKTFFRGIRISTSYINNIDLEKILNQG